MASVFISHATKDADGLKFLVNHLRASKHDVRFTSGVDTTFGVGEDWFERIQRETHSFDLRIFWITPNWQSSQMCGVEYYSALTSGHLPNDIVVLDPKAKFGVETRLQGFRPTGLNWKRRLKSLVDSRLKEVGGTLGTSQPFPGLQPYSEHDRSRFFGRSELINRLLGTLAHHNRKLVERRPIKLLLGQSGVGKTSLLRAGLYAETIVRAEREARRAKEAADRSLVPMPDISSSFDLALTAEEAVRQALGSLINVLDPEMPLNSLADKAVEKYRDQQRPGQGARALVFFDGFERLFDHGADDARAVILDVVKRSRINLVTAVRSDLLPLIIESNEIQGEYYGILVDPVSSSELEEVIKQPIFNQGWTIDDHVVSTLKTYFGRSVNGLPLVAFVLEHLWNEAQTNSNCRQNRRISTELLLELSDGVESPIDRILDSLVSKSEAIVSLDAQEKVFERLVFKMAQWDQASTCIRPRSAIVEPGEERELAQALCGQSSRLFTMSGGESPRMRPSHDRVFVIWPRISKLLKSMQADLILHSEAEAGVEQVGFRWFEVCSSDRLSDYRGLVERWGDALDASVVRGWFDFQNHMSASARSKAEVGALLDSTERARSVLIGLMANQFLDQSDPISSLLVSTTACELGPHGKPYKAVTSPLIKALHQAREIDSVHFEDDASESTIKKFDGGTVDEGDGFSAFSDGHRIDWSTTKSLPTVSRVLSPGHTKVSLLSDGGWGCYFSTPTSTSAQPRQPSIGRNEVVPMALHLHHSAMASEVRYNLGRIALIAQAFAVQKSHLLIALLVDAFDREGKSTREVRIARLPKSAIFELSNLEPQERFLETSNVTVEGFGAGCLAWSKAGPRLLVQQLGDRESAPLVEFLDLLVAGDGSLRFTALKRCQSLEQCHQRGIRMASFSANGLSLITAGHDSRVQTHRIRGADVEASCLLHDTRLDVGRGFSQTHLTPVSALCFSPDGSRAITAGMDGVIKIWDANAGELLDVLEGHARGVAAVEFSGDGSYLYSFSLDRSVKRWDVSSAAPVGTIHHTEDWVLFAGEAGVDSTLCAVDSSSNIWSVSQDSGGRLVKIVDGDSDQGLRVTPVKIGDGSIIIADGMTLRRLFLSRSDHDLQEIEHSLGEHHGGQPFTITAMAPGSGSALILSSTSRIGSSFHNIVATIDALSGLLLAVSEPLTFGPSTLLELPNGRIVVASGTSNAIAQWDPVSGEISTTTIGKNPRARTRCLCVAPKLGVFLLAGAFGYTYPIQVWDIAKFKPLIRHKWLAGHIRHVEAMTLLPDGVTLASVGRDCTLRFWHIESRIPLSVQRTFEDWVISVGVSDDGKRLITGGASDHAVRSWGCEFPHYNAADWDIDDHTHYSIGAVKRAVDILGRLRPSGVQGSIVDELGLFVGRDFLRSQSISDLPGGNVD